MLRLALTFLIAGAIGVLTAQPQCVAATSLAAQSSDAAGIRVVVKPKSVGAGTAVWEFEVTMDTHTTPLSADLVRSSVLIDDSSRRYTPTAWEGDAPGGHHRKGILKFSAAPVTTKSVELQMTGIGTAGPRIFRWNLTN